MGTSETAAECVAVRHVEGVPVYRWGQAPGGLRTRGQLGEERLKPGEGQVPRGYLSTRKFGDVALYDRGEAVRMAPLASAVKRGMEARRTCPECGKVRGEIVRGGPVRGVPGEGGG